MYGLAKDMTPLQILGPATVSPDSLIRLELLLGERVVTLRDISDIISQESGLKTHVLQLAHDTVPCDEDEVTVEECIVEIGIERLRESLRETRFRLKAN